MQIAQHRLSGPNVKQVDSPNRGGTLSAPRYIVMHFTAGRSAQSSVSWLTDPQAKASAHVVIGRDGSITQLVHFDQVAWHAGVSAWKGISGLNSSSIGIELDNQGELVRAGNQYLSWFKGKVPEDEVVQAAHPYDGIPSFWHDYIEPQIASALDLTVLLCQTYPSIEDILGHEDIAPGRKRDPGPAFPKSNFKARVLGRQTDAPPLLHRVTADFLNIRSGPGTGFPTVAPPLLEGMRVRVERQEAQWSWVAIRSRPAVQGWVSNAYIVAE